MTTTPDSDDTELAVRLALEKEARLHMETVRIFCNTINRLLSDILVLEADKRRLERELEAAISLARGK